MSSHGQLRHETCKLQTELAHNKKEKWSVFNYQKKEKTLSNALETTQSFLQRAKETPSSTVFQKLRTLVGLKEERCGLFFELERKTIFYSDTEKWQRLLLRKLTTTERPRQWRETHPPLCEYNFFAMMHVCIYIYVCVCERGRELLFPFIFGVVSEIPLFTLYQYSILLQD